ncbi:MAG: MFS transporter [Caldilineaceae bacterium]|nr:MFS transporter [Caldilineaceae bacterium]
MTTSSTPMAPISARPQPRTTPLIVFHNAVFCRLWTSQFLATVSMTMTLLATSILIFRSTGTVASVGLVLLTALLPSVLFGLFAGVVADRGNRKRILVASELTRAVMMLALPWLIHVDPRLAFVVLAAANSVRQFFDPAHASLIPETVEADRLAAANSMLSISLFGAEMFGLAVAGAMAAAFPLDWIFYLNGVLFFISAAILLPVRLPARTTTPAPTAQPTFVLLREGITSVQRTPALRNFAVVYIPFALAVGLLNAVDLPFVMGVTAGSGYAGELMFGVLEAVGLVAFVTGSYLMAYGAPRLREGQWIAYSFIGTGIGTMLYAQAGNIGWLFACNVIYYMTNAAFHVGRLLLLQRTTPQGMLGRVSSAFFLQRDVCYIAGVSLAVLGDLFSLTTVITGIGVTIALAGLVAWRLPGLGQPVVRMYVDGRVGEDLRL